MSEPLDLEAIERGHYPAPRILKAGPPWCHSCMRVWPCDAAGLVARVRELEARDARCEAHPFEGDDAGCAPCHAVRVRELEAALRGALGGAAEVILGLGDSAQRVAKLEQARAALEGRAERGVDSR